MHGELSGNRCAIGHVKPNRFFLRFHARQALQQSDASVPSQNRVIVVLGANARGLLKAGHGVLEQGHQHTRRLAGAQLSLGSPFVEKASVVDPLVRIRQAVENALRL
jgi:hypothetical protein